jgi:dTDP-4-dehydrorhamnose 3,5-epimerase
MIFTETRLKGAFVLDLERLEDERGFFARSWCEREFKSHRIEAKFVQCNISFNKKIGTLRGMHYQASPYEEAKLIRCTMGAIYDVIVDLRPNSLSYGEWVSTELTSDNRRMIYIPKNFAHGFLTLTDNSEIFYMMSEFYAPMFGRGIKWNDPVLGITWPAEVRVISSQDNSYPDFRSYKGT